jgi:hypothetical protein
MKSSTTFSSTASGSAPESRTASWNLRISKRAPSAALALSRSRHDLGKDIAGSGKRRDRGPGTKNAAAVEHDGVPGYRRKKQ